MSVEASKAVWDHFEGTQRQRVLMLALANRADEHGITWPSIFWLEQKTRLKRAGVYEVLREVEETGQLRTIEGGGGRGIQSMRWLRLPGLDGDTSEAEQRMRKGPKARTKKGPEVRKPAVSKPSETPDTASGPKGPKAQTERVRTSGQPLHREKSGEKSTLPGDVSPGYLCNLLADLIAGNDPNDLRPTVTDAWLTSERLLLTKDGRDVDQAEMVLRWCQADDFWAGNVQSMPKFRQQYGRLFLKANKQPRPAPRAVPRKPAKANPDNVYDLGVVRSG